VKRWLIGLSVLAALGHLPGETVVYAQEAQEPRKEPERPRDRAPRGGRIGRIIAAVTEEDQPVRPLAGVVVPGSGFAAGAALEAARVAGTPWGAGAEGLWSIRDYRHLLVRAGRLEPRRGLPAMRAADSAITSTMEEGRASGAGLAWYVEHRYRSLPTLSFFGHDDLGTARTDYGIARTTTDAVVQWRAPGRAVGMSGRVGFMRSDTFAGRDPHRVDTIDRFGEATGAGGLADTRYVTFGGGALVDRRSERPRPGGGWLAQATATGYRGVSAASPSFVRAALDVRGFRPIGPPRHTLAARLLASADVTAHGRSVPSYLQQTLGGTNSLRGYTSYRLRGERLVHATIESRWQMYHRLDVVPFVDAGAVGRSPIDQGLHGVVVSPGLGLRLKHKGRSIGRLDLAHGREGTRVSFDVGGPF
jgi:hypothetical protein